MIEIFHNPRGSSTRARSQTPRWRTIFLALMLVFTIGSAGPTPAHAQDNPADIFFEVWAFPEKPRTLCVNRTQTFYVSIQKAITKIINNKGYNLSRGTVTGGAAINGSVSPSNIGILDPAEFVVDVPSGGQSTVVFTAKKPGNATLIFKANVEPAWFAGRPDEDPAPLPKVVRAKEARIPIKVTNCNLQATTIGEWRIPGEAQGYIAATSNDAQVKAPDAESPFTGSTTVNWVASVGRVRDCGGTVSIGSSKLDWNGTMSDSDQLTLNGNYQTAAGTFDIECASGSESLSDSMQVELTPDPVSLTIASSGGTVNQSQTLEWEGANPGQITIIIVPVEETGVAVIPGIHDVSWDDFSSLFGALIHLP